MKCKNGQNPDWNKTEMEKFNIAVTQKNLFSFSVASFDKNAKI
jgi:hypothetical protein